MKAALLPDRGVVKVAGDEARKFLNGIVTADVAKVAPDQPCYAALLTPQGKIIADFIVAEATPEDGGGFFLDCPAALAPALMDRLKFYKLRAKVTIEELPLGVLALWDGAGPTDHGLCYPDPRLPALGLRCILPADAAADAVAALGAMLTEADSYEAHRIALGVPRGGLDFIYNDAFPHEADMDQLNGVDFTKGCYVGQETVARLHWKGKPNRHLRGLRLSEPVERRTDILLGEKVVGRVSSTCVSPRLGPIALALVRREAAPGDTVRVGEAEAEVVELPFERD